jgi:hypothetical protein
VSTPKPERLQFDLYDTTGELSCSLLVLKVARWAELALEQVVVEMEHTTLISGREAVRYRVSSTKKVSFARALLVRAWMDGWNRG